MADSRPTMISPDLSRKSPSSRDAYTEELYKCKSRRNLLAGVEDAMRSTPGKNGDMQRRILKSAAKQNDNQTSEMNPIPESSTHSRRQGATETTAELLQRVDVMSLLQELAGTSTTSLVEREIESHHGRIPFYGRPAQRQKWGDDQVLPHINWGDLFFDLFYVAAAYNLGSMLISAMTPTLYGRGIVYFIGIFGPLYNMWESKLVYEARYSVVDYAHQILEVVRVFFLSFAVLHIKTIDLMSDPNSAEMFGFALGLFLESLVHILLKLELFYLGTGDVEAIRNHSKRKVLVSYLPLSLFYLAAVLVSGIFYFRRSPDDQDKKDAYPYADTTDGHIRLLAGGTSDYATNTGSDDWSVGDIPIVLCLAAYVFNFAFTAVRKTILLPKKDDFRKHNVPSNIDFCIHRYGEWIMLMLGEAVLSLLIVDTAEEKDYYVVAILGTFTVIFLQAIKFESQPSHADGHALWRNMQTGFAYSGLIQVLSMGLIAFGVSYKVMLKNLHAEHIADIAEEAAYDEKHRHLAAGGPKVTDQAMAALFVASLTIVLVALEFMTLSHVGARANVKRFFHLSSDESQGPVRWSVVFLVVLKVALLVFTGTLSQWLNDPKWITVAGFLVVICFACIRIASWGIVHSKGTEPPRRQSIREEHPENGNVEVEWSISEEDNSDEFVAERNV